MDELNKEERSVSIKISNKRNELEVFKSEGTKIGLNEYHEPDDSYTNDEYMSYRLEYENSVNQLSGKVQQITSLEEMINLFRKSAKEAEGEIKNLEQEMDYIEKKYYKVHDAELKSIKTEINKTNEGKKICDIEYGELREANATIKSKEKTLLEKLVEIYSHISDGPFNYGENAEKEYEIVIVEFNTMIEEKKQAKEEKEFLSRSLSDILSAITLSDDIEIVENDNVESMSEEEIQSIGKSFVDAVKVKKIVIVKQGINTLKEKIKLKKPLIIMKSN